MAVERHVFKIRHFACRKCGEYREQLAWDYDTFECCGQQMVETYRTATKAPSVLGDEIDLVVRHGPVNDDGSPKRYRSRQELRRACEAKGWTPLGDTPKTAEERSRWV